MATLLLQVVATFYVLWRSLILLALAETRPHPNRRYGRINTALSTAIILAAIWRAF